MTAYIDTGLSTRRPCRLKNPRVAGSASSGRRAPSASQFRREARTTNTNPNRALPRAVPAPSVSRFLQVHRSNPGQRLFHERQSTRIDLTTVIQQLGPDRNADVQVLADPAAAYVFSPFPLILVGKYQGNSSLELLSSIQLPFELLMWFYSRY